MEVYNVVVCKFTSVENHTYEERLIVDEYIKHLCIVDFENNIATDIKTGDSFYILKRDNQNRILATEQVEINSSEYGVKVEPFYLRGLSKKEQLKLRLDYLKIKYLKNDDKQKIKR